MSSRTHTSERRLPRVAVALASRNGERYIRQQILSILWQEECESHIYVRDDGSTDRTLDIVEGLQGEFPGRIVLVDDGLGPSGSAAQNFYRLLLYLRDVEADYFALADQDDIWEARKLARAIAVLGERGAQGYSSNLTAFSDTTAPSLIRKDRPAKPYDYLFQTASAGCTYVLTAPLLELVAGKLSEHRAHKALEHDIFIYAVARSHGHDWIRDDRSHILYRQHDSNVVGSRTGLDGLKARWELARSGWYRQQTLSLAPYLRNSDTEKRVIDALRRYRLSDRLWLASRAALFRRRRREVLVFAALQCVS